MSPEAAQHMVEATGYAIGLGVLAIVLIGGTAVVAELATRHWY